MTSLDRTAQESLQSLAATRQDQEPLPAAARPKPKTVAISIGRPAGTQGTGGGTVGPFTETDATTRTYHTARVLEATDGILTFEVEDLATMDFTDGLGTAFQMVCDAP